MDEESSIPYLISFVNDYYQNLLGYSVEKTDLKTLDESQWNSFCKVYNLDKKSSGIFLPRNQTAIIKDENPLSLFHEYFGHGLYCEQSLPGKKLVDLEKKLLEEEKQKFENKKFSLEDLNEFRKDNSTFNELGNLKKENLGVYELFAVWTEYLLSNENNLKKDFEKKYDSLKKQDREVIDSVVNFANTYGNLATMYEFGLARRTTPERVKKLLEDIYKDKLNDVKFALLYGSRKEFSDIDVFIVGEKPKEFHSDFFDAKMQSPRDLKKGIKNFDVRILIPLINGEFIFGDRDYFEQAKQQVLSQEITFEAIEYNFYWSARMQRLRDENIDNNFLRKKFEGYSKTYSANALALKEGKRIFTKEDLLSYSHREKPIELKVHDVHNHSCFTGSPTEMKGGTEKNAT